MFDHDPCRVDLTELRGFVERAVDMSQRSAMEWREDYIACVKAVEQIGNQAAWPYVDMLSTKMRETANELRYQAERLHSLIKERDEFQKEMDRFLKEFYNKK